MTDAHIFETIIEAFMIISIIFGFIFEDKLIDFEQKVMKKIKRKFAKRRISAQRSKIINYAPYHAEQSGIAR